MGWLRRLFAPVGFPMERREFHYDNVMSGVILDIASERAKIQRFGAASKANGDPRDTYQADKWRDDWLRGYDAGKAQHPFEIYREMFAADKAEWEENHAIKK